MSLLDIAYSLMKETRRPMTAKEMMAAILKSGRWATKGKTPEETLGARIYEEIKRRGEASRFVKVGAGTFALSGVEAEMTQEKIAKGGAVENSSKHLSRHNQTFSFVDCAEKVLAGQGKHMPMHYNEITKIALENGWLMTEGKTPAATMYAQIIQEIQRFRKRGEVPRFVKCGQGRVALSAWDKAGVDFQIKQHHEDVRKKLNKKIMELSPGDFEELISVLFRKMGFQEVSRTRLSGDGGIDVRGTMGMVGSGAISTRFAIQVKRWKRNVQAPTVREVRGSLGTHEQGCIVTTSGFSQGAKDDAQKSDSVPISLIDGKELLNLMLEYQVGVRRKEVPLFEVQDNLLDEGENECSE